MLAMESTTKGLTSDLGSGSHTVPPKAVQVLYNVLIMCCFLGIIK